jgi:hypothetical protein
METRHLEIQMKGRSLFACAAALALSTEFAIAQQPGAKTAPEPKAKTRISPDAERCVSTDAGRVECRKILEGDLARRRPLIYTRARMDSALMKRAALGLQISTTGTRRDTIGVFVSSVTPKGPAENAASSRETGLFRSTALISAFLRQMPRTVTRVDWRHGACSARWPSWLRARG